MHEDDFSSFSNIVFSSFVSPCIKTFFTKFSFSSDFRNKDPSTGRDDPGCKSGREKLKKTVDLKDIAERIVKLLPD